MYDFLLLHVRFLSLLIFASFVIQCAIVPLILFQVWWWEHWGLCALYFSKEKHYFDGYLREVDTGWMRQLLLEMILLSLSVGACRKRKELASLCSCRVDPISEGIWFSGSQTGSHWNCLPCLNDVKKKVCQVNQLLLNWQLIYG